MYLVPRRRPPARAQARVRLADLPSEAWIGGPADCECNRADHPRVPARAGFDPRIAFETDDYAAVQGFVAAGVGVSLIAELGLRTVRDDIVVRPLGPRDAGPPDLRPSSTRATARPPRRRWSTCCARWARDTPSGARSSSS